MRKVRLLVPILILLTALQKKATAQFYFYDDRFYDKPVAYEFGVSLGVMNCLTDVGGKIGRGGPVVKDLTIGNTRLNGSLYVGFLYNHAIGLRLEATYGNIKAFDSISLKSVSEGRYERNLVFRSKIKEIALVGEVHILYLKMREEPPAFSPYVMGGIGFFSFKPQAPLNDTWVDLQPLSTEGQGFAEYPNRKIYKLSQVNFPVGAGVKFDLSPSINMKLEVLHRILKTDYLDDLSTRYINPALFSKYFSGTQLSNALALSDRRSKTNPEYPINPNGGQIRGNPRNRDAYFTTNIKMGFAFGRERIRKQGAIPKCW